LPLRAPSSPDIKAVGANDAEYSRLIDPEQEKREFAWTRNKRQLIAATLAGLADKKRGIDIGCRGGVNAVFYRQECGVEEMYGVDIDEIPLGAARARGVRAASWVSGASALPHPDGFFDVVIATDVIEHILDTEAFVSELARVVRPGGTLIVTTPNQAWWWSRLRLLFGKVPAGGPGAALGLRADPAIDLKHVRLSVAAEWRALFKHYRLEEKTLKGYTFDILHFPLRRLDNVISSVSPTSAHSLLFVLEKASSPHDEVSSPAGKGCLRA